MLKREPAAKIDASAADWVAKRDRGLSAVEQDSLAQWLATDLRHVGALARAEAIWIHGERAGVLGQEIASAAPIALVHPTRRFVLRGMTALAATLVGGVAISRLLEPAAITSGFGETRRVSLPDGSAVTLDTGSSVTLDFGETRRAVRLVAGQAYFEVAHDRDRPFIVEARGVLVRAVGTAFSVRDIPDLPVVVVVREGVVAITRAVVAERAPLLAPANVRATIADDMIAAAPSPTALRVARPPQLAGASIEVLSADAVVRTLAWRDGMLAFEGETLEAAARRFDRYARLRIEIDDPALARQPVAGLFAANDPRGFATAVAASLEARVTLTGGVIHLRRNR